MKGIRKLINIRRRSERGFTLLEYCAGAAVVLLVLYVALNAMGSKMGALMSSVGNWAQTRADGIK
jgi:hypothetical protein